eukprot:scaffold26504_cov56-Phaeocystis_antarctica.AAC.3
MAPEAEPNNRSFLTPLLFLSPSFGAAGGTIQFLRPTTDQKPGWSYLHRGNPRRFSLNIPSKTVRPN